MDGHIIDKQHICADRSGGWEQFQDAVRMQSFAFALHTPKANKQIAILLLFICEFAICHLDIAANAKLDLLLLFASKICFANAKFAYLLFCFSCS